VAMWWARASSTVSATNSIKAKGKKVHPEGGFGHGKRRVRDMTTTGAKATPKRPLLAHRNAGKKSPRRVAKRVLFFQACFCDLWLRRETGFTTNSAAAWNKSLLLFLLFCPFCLACLRESERVCVCESASQTLNASKFYEGESKIAQKLSQRARTKTTE
jgi:hypothetical protein